MRGSEYGHVGVGGLSTANVSARGSIRVVGIPFHERLTTSRVANPDAIRKVKAINIPYLRYLEGFISHISHGKITKCEIAWTHTADGQNRMAPRLH